MAETANACHGIGFRCHRMQRRAMTRWLVTRHPGAYEWARAEGLAFDRCVGHISVDVLQTGDVVLGILPVHLAAQICERGIRYLHLAMETPEHWRGRELSYEEMLACNPRVEEYLVVRK